MKKQDEINRPTSCWNKALKNERLFILLGRDAAAPHVIREWCKKRVQLGLNNPKDDQISEALECASLMEEER